MTDDVSDAAEMRFQLQRVVAYRELCRVISRSGRENIFWAVVIFAVATFFNNGIVWLILGLLAGAELFAGLFKWLWPCAEGFLIDGLVLLLFAGWNASQILGGGMMINPVRIFFGVYLFYLAINRFKGYRQLLRVFGKRPTAAHLAWFGELVHEIRTADPQSDELALDLPTRPHWKAKLLGSTAFFVSLRGAEVCIAAPDEFFLSREEDDNGTGSRRAVLYLQVRAYPEFDIDDATWGNYEKWRSSQAETAPRVASRTASRRTRDGNRRDREQRERERPQ